METNIDEFNKYWSDNYYRLRNILKQSCYFQKFNYSDDILHDVYCNLANSIKKGKKIDYGNIEHLIFITFKNEKLSEDNLCYNKLRETNYDSSLFKLTNCQDDIEEMQNREKEFQKKYNKLVVVEKQIYDDMGSEYGKIFTKKMNGEVLDNSKGERKKYEEIKKHIKQKYNL